ncbi:hypothetical protein COCNU_11G001460 [Cocos nucifera]|uniref:Uncharacterized protein n=1 Tax=Cocos nucifera TaxID=13894 RepID=A0A8K0N8U2_COCNU|nr:hypothetical protein COCNU_11G001460 [Cocos nucifera]
MTSVRFVAPVESVPRPSASSSKRSSGGTKISIRMSSHGPDVLESISPMEVPLDTEDKRKGIGDYRVAHSLLKSVILPTDVQTFEEAGGAFCIQNSYDSLLWLIHHVNHFTEVIREVRHLSKKAEEKAAQANRRMDDAQLYWLKVEDETRSLRKRVKQLESELAKAKARVLEEREAGKSNDEEAEEVEGRKIQIEDVFSPARDDPTAEDAASVPPPAIITLPDKAEVGESRALDGA